MAFQFPNNPTLGQQVPNTASGQTFTWTGTSWDTSPVTSSQAITSSFSTTSITASFAQTANFATRAATYTLPATTTSQWVFLGEWSTINYGATLYMRVVSHAGFNADIAQNQVTELYFKTSNGISFQTGVIGGQFYGDGLAYRNTGLGPATNVPESFRIVQISTTRYFIYGFFNAGFIDNSTYQIQIPPNTTWINSSTVVGAPTGTYINITPSAGKAYAHITTTTAITTNNTVFTWAVSTASGITVSGGNINLPYPGVYSLVANMQLRSTWAVYAWTDTAGNQLAGTSVGLSVSANSADNAVPTPAVGIYTTTGYNTAIQLRLTGNSGITAPFQIGSPAQIIQIA